MARRNRVVVTAIGVLAANGIGKEEFWSSILEGRSGIAPVTLFPCDDLPCRIAGEVKNFDPTKYIDPSIKPDRRLGRSSQLGLSAATLAVEEIRRTGDPFADIGEVPVIMGVSSSAVELREKRSASWMPTQFIPHIVGSGIAHSLGLDSRLLTVSTGCGSGLDAVSLATAEIRNGKADVAITGAADSVMSHWAFECFCKTRKLSTRNDEPEKASRPFDRDRDGGIAAEGAGVLLLENIEHARARGVKAYAEIVGYGSSADRTSEVEGSGMERAARMALANATLLPNQIDHINAHGPSDQNMDTQETRAMKRAFGEHAYRTPISSIKGATGNPMGVGGVLQIISACLTIRDQVIPPTANYETPDPECDLDYVPKARYGKVDKVMVNTHGFGRGNSTLILSRI